MLKYKWYKTQRWKRIAAQQLKREPLCRFCSDKGIVEAASVVDHVIPHRGDQYLFWCGDLQSLCVRCHNRTKYFMENRGYSDRIDDRGLPVDPNHPFNR